VEEERMPQTVLVIDDSSTIREIIKIYLSGRSFEFVEAESGDRGLQLARLMQVDLVIADVKMPGMDGLTFVRHLRADEKPHLRTVPVILLTGEKSEDLKSQGLEAGANAFVQKPVSSGRLKEVVNQLLKTP
jgi:two-component system, chemotaxis family, chemotaxis protein CheY